ncbi:MAG: TetR family transcriptional regulator [Dehalococcoidales bacterium]|nr:TetR family transcriptional regulator [Dehalococcoidales bacterium]
MKKADYGGIEDLKYGRIVKYICEAAVELASTYPAEDITIQMITVEAEISKQTFYNHFPDKYALFNYIFLHDIGSDLSPYSPEDLVTRVLPEIFSQKIKFYRSIAHTDALNCFQNFLYTFLQNYYLDVLRTYYEEKDISRKIKFGAEVFTEITTTAFINYLKESTELKTRSVFDIGDEIYSAVPLSVYSAFSNYKSIKK